MRESLARGAAVGTGVLVVGAVAVFAILQQGDSSPTEAPAQGPATHEEPAIARDTLVELGMRVYAEQRCGACHSIAGVGSPRYPLDGVGSRLTSEEIRLWIVDPQEARPGVRKPAYDDLPPAEFDGLVAYLETLKDTVSAPER